MEMRRHGINTSVLLLVFVIALICSLYIVLLAPGIKDIHWGFLISGRRLKDFRVMQNPALITQEQCMYPPRSECIESKIYQTLVQFSSNTTRHAAGQPSDSQSRIIIEFTRSGLLADLQWNPNHFLLDQWSGILYLVTNCNGWDSKAREVMLPNLEFNPNMSACLPALMKADPSWQDLFRSNKIGTLVVNASRILLEQEVRFVTESCGIAHSFAPSYAYFTGLFLAGTSGSVTISLNESRQRRNAHDQHLVIRHEDRGIFRELIASKHYPRSRRRKSIMCMRSFIYEKVLDPSVLSNIVSVDKASSWLAWTRNVKPICRMVLYNRNDTSHHPRVWEDAYEMKQFLEKQFPSSPVALLSSLPSRFVDQVLLFSGLDVFIAPHGGWSPNVMFLPTKKSAVVESLQKCSGTESSRYWLRAFRSALRFTLIEIPCLEGSGPNMQLFLGSKDRIASKLKRRCRHG